ncbi:MAG: oligopeptide transporter, OPT family [Leptospiraceae bacterium]|nr:oligopeptide transporter, OPT family [Leptospiraceae bacterium]
MKKLFSNTFELNIVSLSVAVFLTLILTAANVYFGLFAGMTISASIPATVLGMGILKGVLRRNSLAEYNIVQSSASAGESLSAGIIFTIPGLVLLGHWQHFDWVLTTSIAICGGVMGVVFMIPLRKSLIADNPKLIFPEGVACARVLETSADRSGLQKILIFATGSGIVKFIFLVLRWPSGVISPLILNRFLIAPGFEFSSALLGVGAIVGLGVSFTLLGGSLFAQALLAAFSFPQEIASDELWRSIWQSKIRFIGAGAMAAGGTIALLELIPEVLKNLRKKSNSIAKENLMLDKEIEKTDIGIFSRRFLLVSAMTGVWIINYNFLPDLIYSGLVTLGMTALAFVLTYVAVLTVGLVGSSNSPVSGMTIFALISAAIPVSLMGLPGYTGALVLLGLSSCVCCAVCTSGDIAQDLKTGSILNLNPRRQQIAELIGILAGAAILAPTLNLLHDVYTIGQGLSAPQAHLFASLSKTLTAPASGSDVSEIIFYSACISLIIYALIRILAKRKFPILPFALGLYLPGSVCTTIFLGALLVWFIHRRYPSSKNSTVLAASGAITGESLMGIAAAFFR